MRGFGWIRSLRLLPPSDKEFFRIFDAMTAKLVEASDLVVELVNTDQTEDQELLAGRLKRMETECDGFVAETINLLDIAPQPPYDRDDITHLIRTLDDVMDWMEQFASRFVIYRLQVSDGTGLVVIRRMTDVVHASCQKLQEVIQHLPKRINFDGSCIAIHDFEAQADEIHHQALADGIAGVSALHAGMGDLERVGSELDEKTALSAEESHDLLARVVGIVRDNRKLCMEVFRFFLQREVMKALEQASDACDTVATTLKGMVMKNV